MAIKTTSITLDGVKHNLDDRDRVAAQLVNENANTFSGTNTFSGSLKVNRQFVLSGIQSLAAAGTNQATATAISSSAGSFVTVTGADNTKAVMLPLLSEVDPGHIFLVHNNAASNTLEIAPNVGDKVGPAADNALITTAADTITLFIALDGAEWVGAEMAVVGA